MKYLNVYNISNIRKKLILDTNIYENTRPRYFYKDINNNKLSEINGDEMHILRVLKKITSHIRFTSQTCDHLRNLTASYGNLWITVLQIMVK